MDEVELQEDARVETTDGTLGRLRHVVVDRETREVTDLVVAEGDDEWLVPAADIADASGDRVFLRGALGAYRGGSSFARDAYHAVGDDEAREETERRAERGGEPLLDARDESVVVGQARDQGARDRPPTAVDSTTGRSPFRIQLREERLRIEKEQEQAGTVEVAKRVTERTETVDVPVREERVIIERTLVGGQPAPGAVVGDDQTIEVPVMRERVWAEKETAVVEEVDVRKESVERTEHVEATLRREEFAVEGDDGLVVEGSDMERTGEYQREQSRRE